MRASIVAKKLGVTPSHVRRVINGGSREPDDWKYLLGIVEWRGPACSENGILGRPNAAIHASADEKGGEE